MDDAELNYSRLREAATKMLPALLRLRSERPGIFNMPSALDVFERLAAGKRVPADEVARASATVQRAIDVAEAADAANEEGAPMNARPIPDRWNLHAMWRKEGYDPKKRPEYWAKQPDQVRFIAHVMRTEGAMGEAPLQPDASGDWWAHWQVGMAYAQWASPVLLARCHEALRSSASPGGVVAATGRFLVPEAKPHPRHGAKVLPFQRKEPEQP